MKNFRFICDGCGKSERATYNGEHWLPPHGWVQLFDVNKALCDENQHVCDRCVYGVLNQPRDGNADKVAR